MRRRNMRSNSYSVLQIDVLRELANIGGGNAATSISSLIGEAISMSIPKVEILHYEEVFRTIMSEETKVNAILMRMMGNAKGYFLFVATDEDSDQLINMMVPEGIPLDDEIKVSALKELVNILVSSYLNALTKLVNTNLISSVPLYTQDMFGAILSSVYMEAEEYDENIMIMKNEFHYQEEDIEGSLYFIPEPGVLDSLFNKIGV
ncbi:MAG: chemotaxis protein CheC [Tissierellia bacterium]|jgi:chemotaxis protein CheC|nr:chemotaxis protein CheC [Tissierellia bacterium]